MLPHGNECWRQLTAASASRPALSSRSNRETASTVFLATRFLLLESHIRGVSQPCWWSLTFDLHKLRNASSIWPLHTEGGSHDVKVGAPPATRCLPTVESLREPTQQAIIFLDSPTLLPANRSPQNIPLGHWPLFPCQDC